VTSNFVCAARPAIFGALVAIQFWIPPAAAATTAQEQLSAWNNAALALNPAFKPSASTGRAFYEKSFTRSTEMPSCSTCHTLDPRAKGKHIVTGKPIAALSPISNPERFTDAAKSDKWFKRNCTDVLGRECSAAEKADLLQYLLQGGK
jgi:cytochrome c peroxidase